MKEHFRKFLIVYVIIIGMTIGVVATLIGIKYNVTIWPYACIIAILVSIVNVMRKQKSK